MLLGRCLVALVSAALLPGMAANSAVEDGPYRIVAFHAQLFNTDRGTLSDDLLARNELSLHNTIIGSSDGVGDGPSNAMLVVVEVAGAPGAFTATRRLELAVRSGAKERFRRQQALGVLNKDGHGFVGFWLYDTGCEALVVSTALLGQRDPSRHIAKIPFGCSE